MVVLAVRCRNCGGSWIVGVLVVDSFEVCSIYFSSRKLKKLGCRLLEKKCHFFPFFLIHPTFSDFLKRFILSL